MLLNAKKTARGRLYVGRNLGALREVTADKFPCVYYTTGDRMSDWFMLSMDHEGKLVLRSGRPMRVLPDNSNGVRLEMEEPT